MKGALGLRWQACRVLRWIRAQDHSSTSSKQGLSALHSQQAQAAQQTHTEMRREDNDTPFSRWGTTDGCLYWITPLLSDCSKHNVFSSASTFQFPHSPAHKHDRVLQKTANNNASPCHLGIQVPQAWKSSWCNIREIADEPKSIEKNIQTLPYPEDSVVPLSFWLSVWPPVGLGRVDWRWWGLG